MKKLLAAVACLVVLGSFSTAFAVEVTGDAYVTVANEYIWRGFNLTGDADFVAQTGADLSAKGFTVSWWGNYNPDSQQIDEVDFALDYSKDLTETVGASVGYITYQVGTLRISEAYVGVSLATILEPSLTFYTTTQDTTPGGGTEGDYFVSLSVGHGIEVNDKVSASIGAALGYMSNDAYDDLHNAELTFGVDYAVSEQIALNASALYSTPLSDDAEDAIEDESAVSLTATLSF